jgi:endonuclease YncB( thermonuclease family)
MPTPRVLITAILTAIFALPTRLSAESVESYAIVQDTATLSVDGRTFRLAGVYIPALNLTCDPTSRRISCETQAAARALDSRIRGFVRCNVIRKNRDGTLTGRCYYDGEDLSAFLIKTGRAMVGPDAPYEYQILERIARQQGLGLWYVPAGGFRNY